MGKDTGLNPFIWKRMKRFYADDARNGYTALKRLGRKRFFELFRVVFNGCTKLIVPKDTSKITLADLEKMWPSEIRMMKVYPRWNSKPVWCAWGDLKESERPQPREKVRSVGRRHRRRKYDMKSAPKRVLLKAFEKRYGKEALRIYLELFEDVHCENCAGLTSEGRGWCENHSCRGVLDAINYTLKKVKKNES